MIEHETDAAWVLAPGVRRVESGRVVIGGSPTTIMRLTAAGAAVLDRALNPPVPPGSDAPPTSAATAALLARLERRGMLVATPRALSPAEERHLCERLTVVVPVRDDADGVAALLGSLASGADRLPVRALIVDDASADPQRLVVVAARFGAEVIRRDRSGGPGAARTTGLAAVRTPWVAFLDADTTVTPDWLATLGAHVVTPGADHPGAEPASGDRAVDESRLALVAPRVRSDLRGRSGELRMWAGNVPKLGTSHARNASGRGRRPAARTLDALAEYERRNTPLDLGPIGGAIAAGTRLSYAPSAAWLARVDALNVVGGFDPGLRYGEDVDLIWRLIEAGWTVRYEPRSRVNHRIRPTVAAWAEQRFRYGTSAAPLAVRHRGALAPVAVSPWSATAWGLAAMGHPVVGLAVAVGSTGALSRRLDVSDPAREAVALAGRGTLFAGSQLARGLIRPWWPLTLVAACRSRRGRLLAVAGLAASAVHGRSAIAIADDIAYGTGVWWGVAREVRRRPAAVIPALGAVLPRFGRSSALRRDDGGRMGGPVKRLRSALGRGG